MEYYSAIKRNEFESVVVRCMNLEHVIHCEVSEKDQPSKDDSITCATVTCLLLRGGLSICLLCSVSAVSSMGLVEEEVEINA